MEARDLKRDGGLFPQLAPSKSDSNFPQHCCSYTPQLTQQVSLLQSVIHHLPLFLRYNRLLEVISHSLSDIVKALKGLVVMSSELELMANSLFINVVPDIWKGKARKKHTHTQ